MKPPRRPKWPASLVKLKLSRSNEAAPPCLIAALGNPGPRYQRHRHTVGFMVGEELRRRHGWPPLRSRFQGLYGDGQMCGRRVVLLLPMVYMNLSGASVGEASRYYRVPVPCILALHDEVEIPFGDVRLKEGGGLGGHNGLRSMEQSLGSREFWRVRVGVGRPDNPRITLADHVLSDFAEPVDDVLLLVGRAADTAEEWLCRD